ncbi:MAG: hypothetical protein IPK26_29570 [Planctomycetes bacterium]|nr:hypothetical protein [Planctomycetota bacterium]
MTASRCPFTDAVLSRHLDGDVDLPLGDGWLSADAVADHLRDCARCRLELARARRLDATLAESSGRALAVFDADPDRMRDLVRRAMAAAAPAPMPLQARRPDRLLPLAAAAAVFAAGFAAAWFGRDAEPPPRSLPPVLTDVDTEPAVYAPATATPPPALAQADQLDSPTRPNGAAPAAAPEPGNAPAAPTAALANPTATAPRKSYPADDRSGPADGRLLPPRTAREIEALAALLEQTEGAQHARERSQQAALRALLDSPLTTAAPVFALAIARLDESWLLHDALGHARKRPAVLAALRSHLLTASEHGSDDLPQLAIVATAARIGHRDLDAAVRQACRQMPALADTVAAALRARVRPDAGVPLLLDIWSDLLARDAATTEEGLARRLFLAPTRMMTIALADELQRSSNGPRRVRIVLALGVTADAHCLPHLLDSLEARNRTEGLAAAWAIGELPRPALASVLTQADSPGAWQLRAALVRVGAADPQRWSDDRRMSAAERALLATSSWSFLQLPTLADLLRTHARTSS